MQLHPEYPSALFNLGVAVALRGDHTGAVENLQKSNSLRPGNSKTLVHLGQASKCLEHHQSNRTIEPIRILVSRRQDLADKRNGRDNTGPAEKGKNETEK